MSEPHQQLTSNKTHRCLMIFLPFTTHTHTSCARTPLSTRVTHTRRLCFACRQPTRPALLRLPLPNGSLRLQRGRDASLPPSSFTLGGLSMGIWNWISCLISYSCVIFSNPLAANCLFLPKTRGGDEGREAACVCECATAKAAKQLETETNTDSQPLPSEHL